MTRDEHRDAAERLLSRGMNLGFGSEPDPEQAAYFAAAQIHATLYQADAQVQGLDMAVKMAEAGWHGMLAGLDPSHFDEATRRVRELLASVTSGAASTPRPSVLDTIAAAIHAADSGIERGPRHLAAAISAALGGIGVQWHPSTINEVIAEVDGWDELGAAELAHHVLVGLGRRAAGDRAEVGL